MLEADLLGNFADQCLVVGKCVAVHQTHGYAPNPFVKDSLQLLTNALVFGPVQDPHRLARKAHNKLGTFRALIAGSGGSLGDPSFRILGIVLQRNPFVNLDDLLVQHVGLPDGQVEDFGPALVADGQAVSETFGDDHSNLLALAFQESVRRHGCSHADGVDLGGVQRLAARDVSFCEVAHDAADALQGRILIVGGVFRQQLDHDVLAIEGAHAVGKSAAAVYGNADAAGWLCIGRHGCSVGQGPIRSGWGKI